MDMKLLLKNYLFWLWIWYIFIAKHFQVLLTFFDATPSKIMTIA